MPSHRFKTFFHEHKTIAVAAIIGIFLILAIITVIIIIVANLDNDGVEGDDSSSFDTSLAEDYAALATDQSFGISKYLPIVSTSPSYKINYSLSSDEAGNYSFQLVLSAYSASARDPMIKRLLSENFGEYDPLNYNIEITNYYDPFTNYTLDDLKTNNYPSGIEKRNYYSFDNSDYSAQTLTHTLYDGTINVYRFLLKSDEPITKPRLLFTYQDIPSVDKSIIKSLKSLE